MAEKLRPEAFDARMWSNGRRADRYRNLGWVGNESLLAAVIDGAGLNHMPIKLAVDFGTGTGAVASVLARHAERVIGIDISRDMLRKAGELPENVSLTVGNVTAVDLPSECAEVVTMRMVAHHLLLEDFSLAIKEGMRILVPGGKFIVVEYVASNVQVLPFEREIFDLKERGRRLWTGEQLKQEIESYLQDWGYIDAGVDLGLAMLRQYSVKDWLGKSGLSQQVQDQILGKFLTASEEVIKWMGVTLTHDGDVLVDRPFAHVVVTKRYDQTAAS